MNAKNLFRLMAMVITMGAAMTGLTSCKDELDTDGNKILGKWYYEKNEPGTIGEGDAAVAYAKIILCGEFQKENKGFWSLIYVDKNNHAINPNNNAFWANCAYTLDGNRIAIKLTASYLPVHQTDWELTYVNNNCLQLTYNDQLIDMHRITTEQDKLYQEWMQELGFGFIDDEAYNINDKDINATNWRDQIGLYVYDGVGTDVKDEKGRTGYTAVYLPWYKDGVVNSNLDPTFCDDITPENGWEWVLNLCGDRSMQNNNFFALYNKYTGILRFFYYMPTSFTSGNDHMWEINMTDNMAQRSVYTYGLPMDLQIKDKSALNQTKANFFVDYITPYVKNLAPDGKITPNSGWWAFDIDMSLYRPDDHSFASGQSVGLQMRSWNEDHVSLTSAIKGALDGKIELDQTKTYTVSKSKGFMGIVKDVVGVGKAAVATVVSAKSGNVGAAAKNAANMAKEGYNLYGDLNADGPQTVTDTLSNIRGTITFGLDATAETSGTIMTSVPVTGVASPTIPGTKFITAGTGVGDGVWNIKTSPVVYYFNQTSWNWGDWDIINFLVYFFDPSSIEVALNPNSFPENDIEWTEVTALCGQRQEMRNDGTGKYRKALGIDYTLNTSNIWRDKVCFPGTLPEDYYWGYDFLYKMEDKQGLGYYSRIQGGNGAQKICGRGIEGDYFIEPIAQWGLPQLEVAVTVVIKLRSKEKPIILHRSYLPVVKRLDVYDTEGNRAIYEQIANKSKVNGKIEMGPLYDYQLNRIHAYFRVVDTQFDVKLVKTKGEGCDDAANFLLSYYIGDRTYIVSSESVYGEWFFEWAYDQPIVPCGYELTEQNRRNAPCSWKLMAKLNEGDAWTVIDEQIDNYWTSLPEYMTVKFDLKEKDKPYQYFRWECTKRRGNDSGFSLHRFNFLF